MLKHEKNIKSSAPDGLSRIWHTPANQYYLREIHADIQLELMKKLPLYVILVNDEHCFEKYYRHRDASGVFSVELVLEGSMHYVQNDKEYQVAAGNVFLVHYDHNNEYTTGPEGHCHRRACLLGGHGLRSALATTRLIEYDVIKLNNFEDVKKTMQECFDELKKKKAGFRRRASILAYKLLLQLEENIPGNNTPDLLMSAVDLMEHHLSQQLSLKKIADGLNTTPISLSRIFQKHLKTSPINYFLSLKIEAAKSMLLNTNLQIQEIAQNTGYSNALYFSTEFKKRTGMSPREFRKQGNGL
jgi:AraC-like DNA-binding protein